MKDYIFIPHGTYCCPKCNREFNFYGTAGCIICPRCDCDLTNYVLRSMEPEMKITKPGTYRDESNRKVEIIDIRDGLAIGWFTEVVPIAAGSWHTRTGNDTENSKRGSNIVGAWEPVTKTVELWLCKGDASFVCFGHGPEPPSGLCLIARKSVTITEGEGMNP